MCVCECVWTYCISSANRVGNVAAETAQPGTFDRFLSSQLEAEQQILLFGRRANHQSESVHALWKRRHISAGQTAEREEKTRSPVNPGCGFYLLCPADPERDGFAIAASERCV